MTLSPQQKTLDQGTGQVQVPRCDNASVGVLIADQLGRYLMFRRVTLPAGVAPAAGHVWDSHTSYEDAARAEVAEELGLTVTSLTYLTGGWRDNKCRRTPGPFGVGHEWRVYYAEVTGRLAPAAAEAADVRWLSGRQLQDLTERTVTYARGYLTDVEFAGNPGIEPVWVAWLAHAGIVTVSTGDLFLIDHVATTGTVR